MRITYFILAFITCACSTAPQITISNNTGNLISDVVSIDFAQLDIQEILVNGQLVINSNEGGRIPYQLLDTDNDEKADQLLLHVTIPENSTVDYQIKVLQSQQEDTTRIQTYCRFVPERMDDFAWENDKVAFRTYGPACQQLFEMGNPAGLISSGIDCWLKRVDYPILDKWYQKEKSGISYHKDNGEGLDNFHVGTSRGCGGTAIRYGNNFIYSENFTEWEILANGPLRSVFKLKYDPQLVNGTAVTETKTFIIDSGDNFYRCDVEFESELSIDTLGIGLTLHDNHGQTNYSNEGWVSYWEPIDDSEMGMAAWIDRKDMLGYQKVEGGDLDNNHIWLLAAPKNNKCTYYAGFGWKKSGQFDSEESWKDYITTQIDRMKNPLLITFN